MMWVGLHPQFTVEHLGFIPGFLSEDDPRPAKEQIHANYISGWLKHEGFTMEDDFTLHYPDDPPLKPVASTKLRDELILLYPYSWLAIIQPDGSYEIARLD